MRHRTRRREIKEVARDYLLLGSSEAKSSCCWHEPEPFLLVDSILHVSFVTADTSHTGVGRVAKAELPPSGSLVNFIFPPHWRIQEQRAVELAMDGTRSPTGAVLYNKAKQQTSKPTCRWVRQAQPCLVKVSGTCLQAGDTIAKC